MEEFAPLECGTWRCAPPAFQGWFQAEVGKRTIAYEEALRQQAEDALKRGGLPFWYYSKVQLDLARGSGAGQRLLSFELLRDVLLPRLATVQARWAAALGQSPLRDRYPAHRDWIGLYLEYAFGCRAADLRGFFEGERTESALQCWSRIPQAVKERFAAYFTARFGDGKKAQDRARNSPSPPGGPALPLAGPSPLAATAAVRLAPAPAPSASSGTQGSVALASLTQAPGAILAFLRTLGAGDTKTDAPPQRGQADTKSDLVSGSPPWTRLDTKVELPVLGRSPMLLPVPGRSPTPGLSASTATSAQSAASLPLVVSTGGGGGWASSDLPQKRVIHRLAVPINYLANNGRRGGRRAASEPHFPNPAMPRFRFRPTLA